MTEPKPCPFCASEKAKPGQRSRSSWRVECDDCGACGPIVIGNADDAVEAWNDRT